MTKTLQKIKHIKNKKRIRRTVATVLLLTAGIIAALPVPKIAADPITPAVETTISIPDVTGMEVYIDSTKTYGVAYITNDTTRYGVLVYYAGGTVSNSTLTIPESIEAYEYDSASGIYYGVYEDLSGNVNRLPQFPVTVDSVTTYYDCTLANRSQWITLYEGDATYDPLTIDVNYINGEAYVPSTGLYTTTGVFESKTNFLTLNIPTNIYGIGDAAFKGCKVSSITFYNGLQVIGNEAFMNCTNLSSVTFNGNSSSLREIGREAFYECRSLGNIVIPSSVNSIGDSAFENCYSLETVNLYGQTSDPLSTDISILGNYAFRNCTSLQQVLMPDYGLTSLGEYIFEDCTSLEKVKFSKDFDTEIPEGTFSGCSSLNYLIIPNADTTFQNDYEISEYNLGTFSEDFCIEGLDLSEIHDYCKLSSTDSGTGAVKEPLAFREIDGDLYEKQVNGYLYVVDSGSNLISLTEVSGATASELADVVIPGSIGGYTIQTIDSNSFWHNENVETVTIPSSVLAIEAEAFEECSNLESVTFEDPVNLQSIGTDAFLTGSSDLLFFGTIDEDSIPFQYAMDPGNNYNLSNQTVKYIKFYSPFPYDIMVQYNPDTDLNELISFPDYDDYKNGIIPYATQDQIDIVASALTKYETELGGGTLTEAITEEEQEVIDAVVNIVLPSGIESFGDSTFTANTHLVSIEMSSVRVIPESAFQDCSALETVIMNSSGYESGETIGDYAFENCDNLVNVTLSSNISEIGIRPFVDCAKLTTVSFNGGTNYVCTNGIIFKLTDGVKTEIVECLETRGSTSTYTVGGSTISSSELGTVTSIADEAFYNCDGVGDVNLSTSGVEIIPAYCFAETSALYSVELPDTCTTIMDSAFFNSAIRNITIPGSVSYIESNAFNSDSSGVSTPNTNITISCEEDSAAYTFAQTYGLTIGDILLPSFTVMFFDYDGTILDEQDVEKGSDAVPPDDPERDGYTFTGWVPSYEAVSRDLSVVAQYSEDDEVTYTVTFYDYDGSVLSTSTVRSGEDASPPDSPTRTGYTFSGWNPSYRSVTSNISVIAQYTEGDTASSSTTTYALTVTKGSGSGNYASGTTVTITANAPATGYVFDKWTSTNTSVSFANANSGTTTITMPASSATVVANYTKSSSTTADSSSTSSTTTGTSTDGTSDSTTTGDGTTTNGTTVLVGDSVTDAISNYDKIQVSVDGSSDDFVVKIKETADATAAVEAALKNEYGTLDNLAYYAMDITLYDSTGTTQITDTTGLSVNITLPIPDDLVTYAGNNNAGSVLDEKLENLDEKFTTIDDVSCISFTATHFSPYTIYVDKSNLTAGISDSSPKTGDFVQTRWLIVLGLFSISMILFLKKDKDEKVSIEKLV